MFLNDNLPKKNSIFQEQCVFMKPIFFLNLWVYQCLAKCCWHQPLFLLRRYIPHILEFGSIHIFKVIHIIRSYFIMCIVLRKSSLTKLLVLVQIPSLNYFIFLFSSFFSLNNKLYGVDFYLIKDKSLAWN